MHIQLFLKVCCVLCAVLMTAGCGTSQSGNPYAATIAEGRRAVQEAMAKVKAQGEGAETIYTLPITDDRRKLVGMTSLRRLVLASADERVGDLMETQLVSVDVTTDQEAAARLVQEANLLAIPVVEKDGKLVGIITVDDVVDVIREEATEDMQRLAGVGDEELSDRVGIIDHGELIALGTQPELTRQVGEYETVALRLGEGEDAGPLAAALRGLEREAAERGEDLPEIKGARVRRYTKVLNAKGSS